MKLHILSDLHMEFRPFVPLATDADVIVLAGDIHVREKGIDWAIKTFPNKPVLYVLGNHEYYGRALPKLTDALIEKTRLKNIIILENSEWIFWGVRFLGCTLWTNLKLLGNPSLAGFKAKENMMDYRKIRVSPEYRRLRPADTVRLHSLSVNWLNSKLAEPFDGPTIVITHHAPSLKSVPPELRNDLLSAAYASNLEILVSELKANLWIHGHIHHYSDYSLGRTRVVCNPRGYPDELVPDFKSDMIIEI